MSSQSEIIFKLTGQRLSSQSDNFGLVWANLVNGGFVPKLNIKHFEHIKLSDAEYEKMLHFYNKSLDKLDCTNVQQKFLQFSNIFNPEPEKLVYKKLVPTKKFVTNPKKFGIKHNLKIIPGKNMYKSEKKAHTSIAKNHMKKMDKRLSFSGTNARTENMQLERHQAQEPYAPDILDEEVDSGNDFVGSNVDDVDDVNDVNNMNECMDTKVDSDDDSLVSDVDDFVPAPVQAGTLG